MQVELFIFICQHSKEISVVVHVEDQILTITICMLFYVQQTNERAEADL